MLTLVITLLGFALYDLAILESRLVLGNEADYMAFETAQAGVERTLHRLFLDVCGGDSGCTNPAADPSWADGAINAIVVGPDTTQFYALPLADTVACFEDPCAENTNSYSVQLKNLTLTEAQNVGDFGLLCTPVSQVDDTCKRLIQVRVTGQFTRGPITGSRTIQLVAGAESRSSLTAALLGGGSGGGTIVGNALIAGELQLLGCDTPPCLPVDLTGTSGVRNNYNDLAALLQQRVPPLQLVTCPAGTMCAGTQVESLGALVRLARLDANPAINLAGFASLGTSMTSNNPATGQPGKPSVSKVFLGDGCDLDDCSDEVGGIPGAQNVFSDVPIQQNDFRCPPACFPVLTDEATIKGIQYNNYAECPSAGNCTCPTGSGCAQEGTTDDFFISHAFKIVPGTIEDANGCGPPPPCNRDVHTMLTTGLTGETNFTKTFICGAQCDDANGNRVNGAVGTTTPPAFQLKWDRPPQPSLPATLSILQCPTAAPGCPGGTLLSDVVNPVLPLLIYVDGPMKICEGFTCTTRTVLYEGHAFFLVKGDIRIDSSLLTSCPDCPDQGGAADDHDSFPRKNLLAFLTPGNVDIGFTADQDVMGVFYAGGQWATGFQTDLVGTVTAGSFDMGSQVPKFFHVPELVNILPETFFVPSGAEWSVPTSNWQECRNPTCS
ncbi:MAG: hypothetical protein ACE5NC_01670 [Anaerolineae bacterium]